MFKKISNAFKKSEDTIIWDKKDDDPTAKQRQIIHRFPNKEHPNFEGVKNVGVRGYERAILYKNGISEGTLTGGTYEIKKEYRTSVTEVVWFDVGEVMYGWGVGFMGGMPPTTKDGYQLGGSGEFAVKIFDAEKLIARLVVGKPAFVDSDIKKSINGEIAASFRNLVNKYTLKGLVLSDKDDISIMFKTMLTDRLKALGLELLTITLQAIAHPPENQSIVDEYLREKLNKGVELRNRIKKIEQRINDLDDDLLDDNISQEEYDDKLKKFNTMKEKYDRELAALSK